MSEKHRRMSSRKTRDKKPGKFVDIDTMSSAERDQYVFSDDATPDEVAYINRKASRS